MPAAEKHRRSPILSYNTFMARPHECSLEATAFGLRREHFPITIVAAWEPTTKDNGNIHRQWARDLSQVLASAALPGGYPNVLGPHERDQAALAFGTNTPRLQTAKRQFNPGWHLYICHPAARMKLFRPYAPASQPLADCLPV